MKRLRLGALVLAAVAALFLNACLNKNAKDDNLIPETKHEDWKILREAVKVYEQGVADETQRQTSSALNTFRALVQTHSDDKIGEESLYYVGRIYYDIRDYHDARVIFLQHKEKYPNSEFAATINALEAEMDRDSLRYKDYVDKARKGFE